MPQLLSRTSPDIIRRYSFSAESRKLHSFLTPPKQTMFFRSRKCVRVDQKMKTHLFCDRVELSTTERSRPFPAGPPCGSDCPICSAENFANRRKIQTEKDKHCRRVVKTSSDCKCIGSLIKLESYQKSSQRKAMKNGTVEEVE